ncbi:hypothetical protein HK101_004854 [Irineochytrium annulatum]|nr:hypothetical protein HK101_004854 [Irineochytrium annulatum]
MDTIALQANDPVPTVIAPHLSPNVHQGFMLGKGVGRILKSATLDFHVEPPLLIYPDTYAFGARTEWIDRDRFMQRYAMWSERLGREVATGEAVIVTFDHLAHKKADVPEEVVKAMVKAEGRELIRNLHVTRSYMLVVIVLIEVVKMPSFVGVNPMRLVRALIPPMSPTLYKGQAGRILIIGGSEEYTGAPFYSGMTALRMGTDLCHVICERSAATAIKSYSPDLIVHPFLRAERTDDTKTTDIEIIGNCVDLLKRVHVVVVGPGLSRDSRIMKSVTAVIEEIKKLGLPVVIDADGLFLVQQRPDLVKGYVKAILTPNVVEFKRLCEKVRQLLLFGSAKRRQVGDPKDIHTAQSLSKRLGHVVILQKGHDDVISDGREEIKCDVDGGLRRCGGQGDVLSGAVAAFLAWAHGCQQGVWSSDVPRDAGDSYFAMLACLGGSTVTRRCAALAFEAGGRSMVAREMIGFVGRAVREMEAAREDGDVKEKGRM